jgi:exonuclease SbcD
VKVLHTADWHVGKTIRGRSRAEEHESVLAEIAGIARREAVDLVLVVGDLFDTAAPGPDAERIVFRALLDLAAGGAQVVVVSGNHDNAQRLQALTPVLELGRIITRANFAAPDDGGVVRGETLAGERWQLAVVPFLSQRWVVRAADLLDSDADHHAGQYAARVARVIGALTAAFAADTINLMAAHLHVAGGMLGGGERAAHTIFDYAVSPAAFPVSAQYVALGHLHRAQVVPGPCPIRYSGSPLQLDFGERTDTKSVNVVELAAGRPAQAREIELSAGRKLRTVTGTLADLRQMSDTAGDDWLKVVVRDRPRLGLADEVRALFPNTVDVTVDDPSAALAGSAVAGTPRQGRSPHDLFTGYLQEHGSEDPSVVALFDRLLDEVSR